MKPSQHYPPATPVLEPQTPIVNTMKRLDFDNIELTANDTSVSVPQSSKKRVKEVRSRFMLPASTTSALNNSSVLSSAVKRDDRMNTSGIVNSSFQMPPTRRPKLSMVPKQPANTTMMNLSITPSLSRSSQSKITNAEQLNASKSAKNNTTTSTTNNSTIINTNLHTTNPEMMRHYLALLNNLLLQYAYCNALGERQLSQQKEKAEKVLWFAFTKVHELREEVHKTKLLLSQYRYLISLDDILTLQENNLQLAQLSTALQHYQSITKSVFATLNLMPLNMTIHPKILETIATISHTLAHIQQVVENTHQSNNEDQTGHAHLVSIAAHSLNNIAITTPQQSSKLVQCKELLLILSAIENQLTSLNIQLMEERFFDEM